MTDTSRVKAVGKTLVQGASHQKLDELKERVEDATRTAKEGTADRFESLAEQLRRSSGNAEGLEGRQRLARRLEKSADYLRYRPTAEVGKDAWAAARKYHLFWFAGGFLAGVLVYLAVKRRKADES